MHFAEAATGRGPCSGWSSLQVSNLAIVRFRNLKKLVSRTIDCGSWTVPTCRGIFTVTELADSLARDAWPVKSTEIIHRQRRAWTCRLGFAFLLSLAAGRRHCSSALAFQDCCRASPAPLEHWKHRRAFKLRTVETREAGESFVQIR